MTPRPYNTRKRAAAREATRRRITEATVALHGEHGILGTSYADIARQADVSIPTVYAHFPDLDHLVEACGQHLMQRFSMPGPEIFSDRARAGARLELLVDHLFDLYAAAAPWLRREIVESEIPRVRRFHEARRAALCTVVREALAPAFAGKVPEDIEAIACVLLDHPSCGELAARLGPEGGRAAARRALRSLLPGRDRTR
jgi:AcrR family transcriptional regulator